jgi:hypothetical protein
MSEVTGQSPVVEPINAPGANPVTAPDAPAGQEGTNQPVTPRTYTEDEHKQLVAKNVSERLAKERRRLEREAESRAEARFYREQLEKQHQPRQESPQAGEPQVKDYADYEQYLVAKAVHQLKQEQQREQQTHQQRSAHEQQQQAHLSLAQAIQDRLEAVAEDIPDIFELVRGNVPFTEPMTHFVAESEQGGKVAHFLATNAKEAARISKLSPAGQFRELVKVEANLSAPPKPTNAPAPIVPNGTQASTRKGWEDMSTAEHVEAFMKRKRK